MYFASLRGARQQPVESGLLTHESRATYTTCTRLIAPTLARVGGTGGTAAPGPSVPPRILDQFLVPDERPSPDYWLSARPAPFGVGLVTAPPPAAGAPVGVPRPSVAGAPCCTAPVPVD